MADKIITVDKFFGLNESVDGSTELNPGEAAVLENFLITDEYNMRTRPGIVRTNINPDFSHAADFEIVSEKGNLWLCYRFGGKDDGKDWYSVFFCHGNESRNFLLHGPIKMILNDSERVIIVTENPDKSSTRKPENPAPDKWDIVCSYVDIENNTIEHHLPYVPLVFSDCPPTGGGVEIEKMNILTNVIRISCKPDGTSRKFVLPSNVTALAYVSVDGIKEEVYTDSFGTFDEGTTFTFFESNDPPKSGSEIIFGCICDDPDNESARDRLFRMTHHENFNGATDTRIFFYGDGTNTCYYTGVPAHGTGFYVPAGNELAVDFSDTPITSMVRHYSRLLAFKPDGVDAITYEPMTLADGSVIAGFYLQPVSRAFGNDAMGQVRLVNNSPRSFTSKSIYEWRVSSGSYRDERYAKAVSQKVAKTIANADPVKIIALDDDAAQTYYVFLNDESGTVLVNRYNLDAWSIYRSELLTNIDSAFILDGNVMFQRTVTQEISGLVEARSDLYIFDEAARYDITADEYGYEKRLPINAHYESGFLSFGTDYKRKYSSRLWLSLLPQTASQLDVTVKTDKRSEYLTKTVGYSLLDWTLLDFSDFSFLTYSAPKIKRVQLKVKKFVYYKLILKVTKPGSRVTILGYDQQLRFSSNAK